MAIESRRFNKLIEARRICREISTWHWSDAVKKEIKERETRIQEAIEESCEMGIIT